MGQRYITKEQLLSVLRDDELNRPDEQWVEEEVQEVIVDEVMNENDEVVNDEDFTVGMFGGTGNDEYSVMISEELPLDNEVELVTKMNSFANACTEEFR